MDENKIIQAIAKLDKKFSGQITKLDEKLSGQITKLDEKFEKRFDKHDKMFDKVYERLLEHDMDIKWLKENMSTKEDSKKFLATMEGLAGRVNDHEQEITILRRIYERLDQKVEGHDKDIKQMKPKLGFT